MIVDDATLVVDWGPAIEAIVRDLGEGQPVSAISTKFHNMLAEIVRLMALRIGEPKVVLTGGCFQNGDLTEACVGLRWTRDFSLLAPTRSAERRWNFARPGRGRSHRASPGSGRRSHGFGMNLLYAEITRVIRTTDADGDRRRGRSRKIALDLLTNVRCGDTVLCVMEKRSAGSGGRSQVEIEHVPGNSRKAD